MVRKYTDKKDSDFYKRLDKYTAALTRLRDMQAEAEQPENRYYCRCFSGANISGRTPEERDNRISEAFRQLFAPVHKRIFPDGTTEPKPIDPRTYVGMELIYRTLLNHQRTCRPKPRKAKPESRLPKRPQDGYVRWEPDCEPRNAATCQRLQVQLSREMQKLQSRKDKGYAGFAPICEECPKQPDHPDRMAEMDTHWTAYIAKWRETIRAYERGDIDWPENVQELFRIQPRT